MKRTFMLLMQVVFILSAFQELTAQKGVFAKVYSFQDGYYYGLSAYATISSRNQRFILAGRAAGLPMIMEVDTEGSVLWAKRIEFANSSYSYFTCATKSADSCYVFAGYKYEGGIVCIKTDQEGDTVWTSLIRELGPATAKSIIETSDKSIVIAGDVQQYVAPEFSLFVTRLDSSGNLVWSKRYTENLSGIKYLSMASVSQTPDGGLILVGNYESSLILLKLSSDGEIEWSKYRVDPDIPGSIGVSGIVQQDRMIILTYLFFYEGFVHGYALLKTDLLGNPLWGKYYNSSSYVGLDYEKSTPQLHFLDDGHFIFVSRDNGSESILFKTDTTGDIELTKKFQLEATDVLPAENGGYIIPGYGPLSYYDHLIGILKTDSTGNTSDCSTTVTAWTTAFNSTMVNLPLYSFPAGTMERIPLQNTGILITVEDGCVGSYIGIEHLQPETIFVYVHPNPSAGEVTIGLNSSKDCKIFRIVLINTVGQIILVNEINQQTRADIDLSPFPSGLYLVRIETTKGAFTRRLILQH